jgi:phage shock protein PspC (stress-responsive transcriptional regulator)
MSIADELHKLESLRSSGTITESEFARAKALILDGAPVGSLGGGNGDSGPLGKVNLLKKFARSSKDNWLGGVCGGLGQHTPVPSWAWRAGFCLLLLSFGTGLIPYVLLWIFVPLDEGTD